MRRIRALPVIVVAMLFVAVPAAQASFHLNKVNEVMLQSSAGDSTVQFVELFDGGGSLETFPAIEGPYKLVVYDAGGNMVGQHTLNGMAMSNARAAGRPYLVSTSSADAALHVTGDEQLDIALPLAAGQACYTATASSGVYSCVTWGCISHAVDASTGTGSAAGAVPPAGMSAQRQSNSTIQIAAPTPKAANTAGSSNAPCSSGGGGGGNAPGGGVGTPPANGSPAPNGTTPGNGQNQGGNQTAFRGVRLRTHAIKVGKRGRVSIALTCPVHTGSCSGRITLTWPGTKPTHTRFRLAAGKTHTLSLTLPASARAQLARKKNLSVRWAITAQNGTGESKTTTGTLQLKFARHP